MSSSILNGITLVFKQIPEMSADMNIVLCKKIFKSNYI